MRYLSICSGIEAATVAWKPLGWKAAGFAEIDRFPCAVLKHHYPEVKNFGDFTRIATAHNGRSGATTTEASRTDGQGLRCAEEFCGELRQDISAGCGSLDDGTGIRSDAERRGSDSGAGASQAGCPDLAPGSIDLLVGGTPCQDFSVAGLRAGLDGARGNLTLEFARLAERLRPRWLVWENVPGVFSSNDGRDFGAVLACFSGHAAGTFFEPPEDGWRNSGIIEQASSDSFGLAWRVLDAQYAGVPQHRRRVFIVGYLGDWRCAAAVLFERHSLSGNNPPRRKSGQRVADSLTVGANQCSGTNSDFVEDVAPTICARTKSGDGLGTDFDFNGGLIAGTLKANGPGTSRTGFDCEDFLIAASEISNALCSRDYKGSRPEADQGAPLIVTHALATQCGQATEDGTGRGSPIVPVTFQNTGHGWWNESSVAQTVRSADGGGPLEANLVAQTLKGNSGRMQIESDYIPIAYSITPDHCGTKEGQDDIFINETTVGRTIDCTGGDPTRKQGGVIIAYGLDSELNGIEDGIGPLKAISRSGGGVKASVALTQEEPIGFHSRQEPINLEDCSLPLEAKAGQAVAFVQNTRDEVREMPYAGAVSAERGMKQQTYIRQEMAVRRLTPRECERLQGFPDDYTKIDARAADGPRYRALGNSMAVPVMAWIGERIQMVEEQHGNKISKINTDNIT